MSKKILDFLKKLWAWLNEDDEPPPPPTPAELRLKDLFYKYEKVAETATEYLNMREKQKHSKTFSLEIHKNVEDARIRLAQQLRGIGKTIHNV